MRSTKKRALLCGGPDGDGAWSVWAQAFRSALAEAGCDTTLLPSGGRSPSELGKAICDLDRKLHFDIVLVHGLSLAGWLAEGGQVSNRLWTHLTELPATIAAMTPALVARLRTVATASRFVLVASEEARGHLEAHVPDACWRTHVLPAALPPPGDAAVAPPLRQQRSRIAFPTGCQTKRVVPEVELLPARLDALGLPAELHRIDDVFSQAAACDLGLVWPVQGAELGPAAEVLAFCHLGLPVVTGRTPQHEALLGADYPLFVDGCDLASVVAGALTHEPALDAARERCAAAGRDHSAAQVKQQVRKLVMEAFPIVPALAARAERSKGRRRRPLRILIVSDVFHFFSRIMDYLASLPGLEVRVDAWTPRSTKQDLEKSREFSKWADVVMCEWCKPHAVWYSRHKRPGQRLLVRLHKYELFTDYPRELAIDAVDKVVCVNAYRANLACERMGWPADKVTFLPNYVDCDQFNRPKLPGSEWTLGLLGASAFSVKRPDRALDILSSLRRREARFRLSVKTKMPWDYPAQWRDSNERVLTQQVLDRIQRDPYLRNAVVFDPHGPDTASWFRRIGFILSTSDVEGSHVAPSEGMASRSVPVIINWSGAETTYSPRWIHGSTEAMADFIYETATSGRWRQLGAEARDEALSEFGLDPVRAQWVAMLTGDLP